MLQGLLSLLPEMDEHKRNAMLAAAAAMLQSKGSTAQGIGAGLGQGLLGYQTSKGLGDRRAEEAQQRQAREMMMEQQRRQMAEQDQMKALAGRAFAPAGPAPNDPYQEHQAPAGGGMQEFAQGMMGINPAIGAQFMPKPKEPSMHALSPGQQLYDSTGKKIAAGPEKAPELKEIKSGNKIHTYERQGDKWVKIAEAPLHKPDGPDKPDKPPQGYRYRPDMSLEPIPGGPADAKVGKEAEALQRRQEGALARADMVLGNVSQAINDTGFTTAGPVGAVMKKIPGTGARDLDRKLDAVRANIGFAELQAMREASPTGGALGQVAVQELNMLQSVLGSLDTSQSPDQLLKNLYAIEKHYNNWKRAVKESKSPPASQSGGWSIKPIN